MATENEAVDSFYVLPEDCIASVLSFTTPSDACSSSSVSTNFRSAAETDAVWERFLPPQYRSIISRSADSSSLSSSSKKQLYLRLCDHPLLIDDGRKVYIQKIGVNNMLIFLFFVGHLHFSLCISDNIAIDV
jgi:hypothetical protein